MSYDPYYPRHAELKVEKKSAVDTVYDQIKKDREEHPLWKVVEDSSCADEKCSRYGTRHIHTKIVSAL